MTLKEILFSQATMNVLLLLFILMLALFVNQTSKYRKAIDQIREDLDLREELEFTELCKLCAVLHEIGKIE